MERLRWTGKWCLTQRCVLAISEVCAERDLLFMIVNMLTFVNN